MTSPFVGSEHNEFFWSHDGIRRETLPPVAEAEKPSASETPPVQTGREHRKYPRIDLKLPVLYKVLSDQSGQSSPGTGLKPFLPSQSDNFSPGGACLVLAENLKVGTVLALSIHLTDQKQKISAVGKVAWTQPTETDHHFLIGIEFLVLYRKQSTVTEYVTSETLEALLSHE